MIGSADNQDQPAYLSFDALNNIMKNMKAPQFDYDGFKVLYDTNPDLQPLVKNFDQDGVELNTKSLHQETMQLYHKTIQVQLTKWLKEQLPQHFHKTLDIFFFLLYIITHRSIECQKQ